MEDGVRGAHFPNVPEHAAVVFRLQQENATILFLSIKVVTVSEIEKNQKFVTLV